MTTGSIEQKVRQLDNAVDARLDAHDRRFEAIEGKLDRVLEILER